MLSHASLSVAVPKPTQALGWVEFGLRIRNAITQQSKGLYVALAVRLGFSYETPRSMRFLGKRESVGILTGKASLSRVNLHRTRTEMNGLNAIRTREQGKADIFIRAIPLQSSMGFGDTRTVMGGNPLN